MSRTSEGRLPVIVRERERLTDDIVRLTLGPADGAPLPAWTPGAHIDLVLGPCALVRQYSLCGDPRDRTSWRVAVLREAGGRGGSVFVHDQVREGLVLEASSPRNHFELETAGRYVFIAGGIGVTPIVPMLAAADAAGAAWSLTYGARGRDALAFAGEAATYGDRVRLHAHDESGPIDLPAALGEPDPTALVYCCGPEPLLAAVEDHLALTPGWSPRQLRTERFAPRSDALDRPSTPFEVELRRTGVRVQVAADQSVLEAVRAAGVVVESSCAEGTCGTCETAVLGGRVDHRDAILDDDERAANDVMFLCVSRAADGELVLDL
ncbi:PDR/VanB family oxidoreductase [Nocardioides humi]|uniref:PDR/VanB family oxidoreductase n=1 Tax=Nocardioides humi TaxID=449461 RepID=A0ABN2BQU9_9ACTN|nr:PDR/VanB family oxidoreductase [Nocardioides humi]